MQLREKVHDAISKMPTGALTLLYEQIKALEKVFQKILPTLTENVNELSRITQDIKGKGKKK